MFRRRAKETRYSEKQMRQCLTWLAQNMVRRGQTVFFLEDVVPEWFLDRSVTAPAAILSTTALLSVVWMWLLTAPTRLALGGVMAFVPRSHQDFALVAVISLVPVLLVLGYERHAGPVDGLRIKWPGTRRLVAEVVRGVLSGSLVTFIFVTVTCWDNRRCWQDPGTLVSVALSIATPFVVAFVVKALVSARMSAERSAPDELVKRSIASAGIVLAGAALVVFPCRPTAQPQHQRRRG
jgi:hypothetical protein